MKNGHRLNCSLKNACIAIGALAILVMTGCVQLSSVPGYARSGDTLVLGLGGIQRNANGAQSLNTTTTNPDLYITITDSANVTYPLTAKQTFKAYPDYGSLMNFQTIGKTTVMAPLPIPAFDGGWFVTVSLTGADGLAIPNLAVGSATISITSPTGKLVNSPSTSTYASEGNLTHIPVEIIAGQSNPNSTANNNYDKQFNAYSSANTAITSISAFNIAPSSLSGITAVGGMQVAIKYNPTHYSQTVTPLVIPYSHNPSINLQQNIVNNNDGTQTINVILTAPKGFAVSPTPLIPSLRDLNLRVLYFGATTGYNVANDFQIMSSKFIDTSGNTIAGMTAIRGPLLLN